MRAGHTCDRTLQPGPGLLGESWAAVARETLLATAAPLSMTVHGGGKRVVLPGPVAALEEPKYQGASVSLKP